MIGRCNLCDDPRWFGWLHERSSWWSLPTMRPLLLKVHYPYDCGYDPWAVARGLAIDEEEEDEPRER